jgi:hypothetical protein
MSFALICEDPDAPMGTFVHWVIWNIPGKSGGMVGGIQAENSLPDGSCQGQTTAGEMGYRGPCPPPGKPHRYFFRLYALDSMLDLRPGADKTQVENVMQTHILAETELMGLYSR